MVQRIFGEKISPIWKFSKKPCFPDFNPHFITTLYLVTRRECQLFWFVYAEVSNHTQKSGMSSKNDPKIRIIMYEMYTSNFGTSPYIYIEKCPPPPPSLGLPPGFPLFFSTSSTRKQENLFSKLTMEVYSSSEDELEMKAHSKIHSRLLRFFWAPRLFGISEYNVYFMYWAWDLS